MDGLVLLLASAGFLGFIHTLLGPDHYLPFIVLGKARSWSQTKTLWITTVSGIGHVGGSVIIGVAGIAMGIGINKLELLESHRGDIVAWLLMVFGLAYLVYGVLRNYRNSGHSHIFSFLAPKKVRDMHNLTHADNQSNKEDSTKLTPWILFLIFVFGPCEVLIPLLMFPASEYSIIGIALVSIVFGIATVLTMLTAVFLGLKGASFIKLKNGDKYFHIIAGAVILLSGIGMAFLGW